MRGAAGKIALIFAHVSDLFDLTLQGDVVIWGWYCIKSKHMAQSALKKEAQLRRIPNFATINVRGIQRLPYDSF